MQQTIFLKQDIENLFRWARQQSESDDWNDAIRLLEEEIRHEEYKTDVDTGEEVL